MERFYCEACGAVFSDDPKQPICHECGNCEPFALTQIESFADLLHALKGDHGDRLNFVASLLMEARHLPLPDGVDWDAWAVTLDEADLFVKEARAAIAKAEGGA